MESIAKKDSKKTQQEYFLWRLKFLGILQFKLIWGGEGKLWQVEARPSLKFSGGAGTP